MAEFTKAAEVKGLVEDRLAHIRRLAEQDRYFAVRQHEMHMRAYMECKCYGHDCGGCRATLAIAVALEGNLPDDVRAERERAIASNMWTREQRVNRERLLAISQRAWRKRDGEAEPRAASIARDAAAEAES